MIAISMIFLGSIALMFAGINAEEKKVKPFFTALLALSGIFAFLESKGVMAFDELFAWVPKHMVDFDAFGLQMVGVLSILAAIIINLMPAANRKGADILALMAFSLCGGILMIGAKHLVVLFLGIEVLSIPLFVLAGSDKDNISGNEAALKYFLMGAFSSAIFLLGAAFLYGGSAVMTYQEMFLRLSFSEHFGDFPVLMKAGMILVMVGLLFKVSAVPFHFWSPDVYEGSPNRVTSFMAVIVKIAGFVALANFMKAFLPMLEWTSNWLLPISAITILGGNIAAFAQKSFKRMLAYSSISHAGYLLLFALTSMQDMSVLGTYLLAYGLSTALLFYLFDKYANGDKNGFDIFTGLTFTNRTDTIALVVATLSIAGIPGTIGFIGKYQLFSTAFGPQFWGVMIALLGSIISIGYYFKPFKYAFRTESDTPNQWNWSWGSICSVVISSVILALGLFPYLLSLYF